ncbi:MAG: hypothetical protein E7309_10880 [Butyrivibrio sp.]|nr:hypothetical protein [Butyrivibrio sp.]
MGILEPGEVAITPAFNLDAKYIIHASGPWWDGGKHDEVQLLTNTIATNVTLVQQMVYFIIIIILMDLNHHL